MKNIISKLMQVIVDIIFGVAAYWFFTNICILNGQSTMLATITVTAIFAEFTQLKFRK